MIHTQSSTNSIFYLSPHIRSAPTCISLSLSTAVGCESLQIKCLRSTPYYLPWWFTSIMTLSLFLTQFPFSFFLWLRFVPHGTQPHFIVATLLWTFLSFNLPHIHFFFLFYLDSFLTSLFGHRGFHTLYLSLSLSLSVQSCLSSFFPFDYPLKFPPSSHQPISPSLFAISCPILSLFPILFIICRLIILSLQQPDQSTLNLYPNSNTD